MKIIDKILKKFDKIVMTFNDKSFDRIMKIIDILYIPIKFFLKFKQVIFFVNDFYYYIIGDGKHHPKNYFQDLFEQILDRSVYIWEYKNW